MNVKQHLHFLSCTVNQVKILKSLTIHNFLYAAIKSGEHSESFKWDLSGLAMTSPFIVSDEFFLNAKKKKMVNFI